MYNKYLGGIKVIKYVVNREKYSRRKEARNKIKVWNPEKKENSRELTAWEQLIVCVIFIGFLLKLIF